MSFTRSKATFTGIHEVMVQGEKVLVLWEQHPLQAGTRSSSNCWRSLNWLNFDWVFWQSWDWLWIGRFNGSMWSGISVCPLKRKDWKQVGKYWLIFLSPIHVTHAMFLIDCPSQGANLRSFGFILFSFALNQWLRQLGYRAPYVCP